MLGVTRGVLYSRNVASFYYCDKINHFRNYYGLYYLSTVRPLPDLLTNAMIRSVTSFSPFPSQSRDDSVHQDRARPFLPRLRLDILPGGAEARAAGEAQEEPLLVICMSALANVCHRSAGHHHFVVCRHCGGWQT